MTLEELKKGEHVTVEYKLDIPQEREKYLKSAVAFANGAGGRLIFGVKNQTWDVIGFPDDEVFQKYDAVTDSFVRDRVRTEIGQTYSVETGAKRTDELNFIRDMLTSESVFLALEDREVKVIPSVETMGYRQRQTEPESFKITFTPVEDESNITALRTKYGSVKPRIFTSVFSEQFN